ncbi:MAG TPA: hypothetical protein EYN91_04835 [Candidatus Melainabacteria bacterium]|jgi:hypothetical protein|nr:hypothetical protein [Candidatus Melainabacteria bacterium]HIN67318.1 hypothetical protein [Candidatus Obscuribacterales bacterium]
MDAEGKKQRLKKVHSNSSAPNARAEKVKKLFDESQDSSGYDEQAWPQIKEAPNENHSRSHNLFNE